LPADGSYAEVVIEEFQREGVDIEALAARLQREGVEAFATSWHALLIKIQENMHLSLNRNE
jgi:transaldolase